MITEWSAGFYQRFLLHADFISFLQEVGVESPLRNIDLYITYKMIIQLYWGGGGGGEGGFGGCHGST